jgi:tyrosyl-tRNA synthetase
MLKHLGADAVVVDNATWLGEIRYLDFLREVGRFFSVNELLASETYRARLESGRGLNFVEINYRLLQAYDFLHLFREYQCEVQIGGSDQWSNILAGVDLIRRIEGVEAFGLVTPLLTTSAGTKMGKTADGTIWLDPELTSPFDFYQYWLNVEDESIEQVLALLTSIPMDEVRELASQQGSHLRSVKDRLAHEVTMMVHGREAADAARQSSHTLFGDGDGSVDAAPQTYVAEAEVAAGLSIVDLLITTGLASSRGSARRLIIQGGAYVNDRRVDNANTILGLDDFGDGKLLLRSGKKRYHLVQISTDN